MTKKVWGGRFRENINEEVDSFNSSIRFDRRLYPQDIQGSIAHCRMLAKQGIISEEEASLITDALADIKRDMDKGETLFDEDNEDIHTLVEKALVDRIGTPGEKIHTGRSRNDQVVLDFRMYVKEACERADTLIRDIQQVFVELGEKNLDLIMPGYTHLQPAQPVLLTHYLLAYFEMFKRDRQRFADSFARMDVLPLGSAALAGTTFNIDRLMVAEELGFERISDNSIDAVSDRDFVLEYLFNSSVLMMHMSRLSEELIIWSSEEFGFVILPEAFCTGSSIMPQKKNPDVLELIRGKTGRVYGNLMAFLTTMKSLPLAYNKDMQEDKEALFDTADNIEQCLLVMAMLLREISFNAENMKKAYERGYLMATDMADYLVTKGIPFRKAHEVVGKIVLFAIDKQKSLKELTLEELKGFASQITEDVFDWLVPAMAPARRLQHGATSPRMVKQALEKAKQEVAS